MLPVIADPVDEFITQGNARPPVTHCRGNQIGKLSLRENQTGKLSLREIKKVNCH
jgi:hypothetical protein